MLGARGGKLAVRGHAGGRLPRLFRCGVSPPEPPVVKPVTVPSAVPTTTISPHIPVHVAGARDKPPRIGPGRSCVWGRGRGYAAFTSHVSAKVSPSTTGSFESAIMTRW